VRGRQEETQGVLHPQAGGAGIRVRWSGTQPFCSGFCARWSALRLRIARCNTDGLPGWLRQRTAATKLVPIRAQEHRGGMRHYGYEVRAVASGQMDGRSGRTLRQDAQAQWRTAPAPRLCVGGPVCPGDKPLVARWSRPGGKAGRGASGTEPRRCWSSRCGGVVIVAHGSVLRRVWPNRCGIGSV
jgi:hypothetical protein